MFLLNNDTEFPSESKRHKFIYLVYFHGKDVVFGNLKTLDTKILKFLW